MTRIRCRDTECLFNKKGLCTSEQIEYDPEAGCLTMEPRGGEEEDALELEEEGEDLEEVEPDEEEEAEEEWDEDEF